MFHHFHGASHIKSQGSISESDFRNILLYLQNRYSILTPEKYAEKLHRGTLSDGDVCLTFDDSLKCQYEIALPVLEEFNLKAFFFIYSSVLEGKPNFLEIYRDFRFSCFEDIDHFYDDFFNEYEKTEFQSFLSLGSDFDELFLSEFDFYTLEDRKFRYARDCLLSAEQYNGIMQSLMKRHQYDHETSAKRLWMDTGDIVGLENLGHVIGLHSHTHPTRMDEVEEDLQHLEYTTNARVLEGILSEPAWAMSHPCGRYTDHTLAVLQELGVRIGFRSSMDPNHIASHLEVPRLDHTVILNECRSH